MCIATNNQIPQSPSGPTCVKVVGILRYAVTHTPVDRASCPTPTLQRVRSSYSR